MTNKIFSYLYLVIFNWYFIVGFTSVYICKSFAGGRITSVITGAVCAILISELLKYLALR